MQLAETELYTEQDPEDPSKYVNFHAFAATLCTTHIPHQSDVGHVGATRRTRKAVG